MSGIDLAKWLLETYGPAVAVGVSVVTLPACLLLWKRQQMIVSAFLAYMERTTEATRVSAESKLELARRLERIETMIATKGKD